MVISWAMLDESEMLIFGTIFQVVLMTAGSHLLACLWNYLVLLLLFIENEIQETNMWIEDSEHNINKENLYTQKSSFDARKEEEGIKDSFL